MDYEKCWKELFYILQTEIIGLSYISPKEERKITSDTIMGVLVEMNKIKYKYQPKQYTWSEILALEPLPKKIMSGLSRTQYTAIANERYEFKMSDCKFGDTYYIGRIIQPSIQEMRNLWTIIE